MKKSVISLFLLCTLFSSALFAGQSKLKPVKPEYEGKRSISLFLTKPPKDFIGDAKVILVSGYQSERETAKVEIDQPNTRVILFLTSHNRVDWEVTKTKTTDVIGIVVGTADRQGMPTVITNFYSPGYYFRELSYQADADNINFVRMLAKLNLWFGIDKIDAFRGGKLILAEQKISGLDTPNFSLTLKGPPIEEPKRNFDFYLHSGRDDIDEWTLTGPKVKSDKLLYENKVLTEDGEEAYTPTINGIALYSKNLPSRFEFNIPATHPKISFIPLITYDSKRKIVTILNNHRDNFIYRFDTVKKGWINYQRLDNIHLQSLSYDEFLDRYVGWTRRADLVFLSPEGEVLSSQNIKNTLQGLGRIYDKNNEAVPRLVLKPHGNQIALIYLQCSKVYRIWSYDLTTQDSILTYKTDVTMANGPDICNF